jgi:hypothetical protein
MAPTARAKARSEVETCMFGWKGAFKDGLTSKIGGVSILWKRVRAKSLRTDGKMLAVCYRSGGCRCSGDSDDGKAEKHRGFWAFLILVLSPGSAISQLALKNITSAFVSTCSPDRGRPKG